MTASEHRLRARNALKGNWMWAALTSLVAVLTGAISGSGADFEIQLSETEAISLGNIPESLQTILVNVLGYAAAVGIVVAVVVTIAQIILGGVVGIGYRRYLLNLIDGEEAVFDQLFSQFHRLGQAVLVRVLRWAVGGAIPVAALTMMVPMLAAGDLLAYGVFALVMVALFAMIYVDFGFAMAEFVMADNESCGAVDALKRSWAMMDGNRVRLWCLELSFIGWGILASFTLGIGGLFLTPYVQTAVASFYREMKPKSTNNAYSNDGYTDCAGANSEYL